MVRNTARGGTHHALAKVSPPVSIQALPRLKLFEKLESLQALQTIWISSPAGSGKTTLVSTYLEEREIPCLWYQVDVGDDDPATLFYYLGQAAHTAVPHIRKAFPALTPEYLLGLPTFTLRFFEDLCCQLLSPLSRSSIDQRGRNPDLVLVFDNCHEVPDASPFHTIIMAGLARIPPQIGVILMSRTSPPPAYARLLANGQMGLLGWDDLRLTREETERIICMKSLEAPAQETIDHIHRVTDGWAAGITLMLAEIRREGFHDMIFTGSTPEEIMFYFGSELFERLDAATKDFLLKAAFLPKMTPAMAQDLTGNPESGRILSALHRNNFFIHRHFQDEPAYEFHPLFREFLMHRARETFTRAELETVMRFASGVLDNDAQIEAAMDLLKEISGFEVMIPTIIEHAPALIEQGRYRILQKWLASIPDDTLEKNPWLMYWKGVSLLPFDPAEAKTAFERAFSLFSSTGDTTAMLMSVSGITEAIQLSFSEFAQYDPWISVIEKLFSVMESIPSKELEARVLDGMVTALVLRQPDHPDIEVWVRKAASLLHQSIPLTIKARLIHAVLFYYILQFNVAQMDCVYDQLKATVESEGIPPVAVLLMYLMEANYHVMKANHDECLRATSDGLRIAGESGIHILDHFFVCHAAMSCLNENDLLKAQEIIAPLAADYTLFSPWKKKVYHQVKAREALLKADGSEACFHAGKTLEFIKELGFKVHLPIGCYMLAQALHMTGAHDEERRRIEESYEAVRIVDNSTHAFYTTLLQATCSFDRGDEASGYALLKEAFILGREHGHLGTYMDIPAETARLCIRAIEAGIEPEYARWLIRKRRFTPDPPPCHLEGWPWPVKIYTLGRFSILIEDTELTFSKKAQKKPLDVLKTMVSGGGSNISDAYVADLFWPEADGDQAMQAFATTLHRLRRLLGRRDAVSLQNGVLSLDTHLCWIDARAFEYQLSRAEALWKQACTEDELDRACEPVFIALELYKGEFLPDDDTIPDVIAMREYLHARFLKAVYRLGECLIKTRQYEKARQAIERGLDIDTCAEELYRLLMTCLHGQGKNTEALGVFERCRRTLRAELDATPSADTETLARTLRTEKTH